MRSASVYLLSTVLLAAWPFAATGLTPGPTNPSQCPTHWQISNERAETFQRTYQALYNQNDANRRQCPQYGSMSKERFACDDRAQQWYETNKAKADAEYDAAKAAYERRRDQCLGIANQNMNELAAQQKQAEQLKRQQESIQRAEEQRRVDAFNAEMRRGQAERDAYNRAAEERNRLAQQQYQVQQQAQQQAAIARQAEAQRQAQIRAEQAARQAQTAAEQQQAVHELRMGLLEQSGKDSQARLDTAKQDHQAIAAANADEDALLTAMMAKMEAVPRAVREVKADMAASPIGRTVDDLKNLTAATGDREDTEESGHIEYRRAAEHPARNAAVPSASGGDAPGQPGQTCNVTLEQSGNAPADASITAHTETLMYRLDQALARLDSQCAGSPDYAQARRELTDARDKAEQACNAVQSGGRRCTATRHY